MPSSITHLEFGMHFNQPVNNLPSSIIDLSFGYSFNQPINNLPSSITRLQLGREFKHPLIIHSNVDKLLLWGKLLHGKEEIHNYLKNINK